LYMCVKGSRDILPAVAGIDVCNTLSMMTVRWNKQVSPRMGATFVALSGEMRSRRHVSAVLC
jgi:hypothetical protein